MAGQWFTDLLRRRRKRREHAPRRPVSSAPPPTPPRSLTQAERDDQAAREMLATAPEMWSFGPLKRTDERAALLDKLEAESRAKQAT